MKKMILNKVRKKIIIGFLSFFLFSSYVDKIVAQTLNKWQGSSGDAWNTNTNWSLGTPPNGTQTALFENFNGTVAVDVNVTAGNLGGISIVGSNLVLQASGGNRTVNVGNGQIGDDLVLINSNLTVSGNATGNRSMTLVLVSGNTGNIINSKIETKVGGTGVPSFNHTGSAANLVFDPTSLYIHNHNGGSIPTATWQTGSSVSITGITGTAPTGFAQQFSNLYYNCTHTAATPYNQNVTVLGTFYLQNTGTPSLRISNTVANTIWDINNFEQSGGLLNFGNSTNQRLIIRGNFNQTGGAIISANSTTARLVFQGTSNQTFYVSSLGPTDNFFSLEINNLGATPNNRVILQNSATLPTIVPMIFTSGVFDLNDNSLSLNGTVTGTSGSILGSALSDLSFLNASGPITLPSIINRLNNFISQRTATITLSNSLTVTGTLSLTGTLNIGANTLSYYPQNYANNQNFISTNSASRLELYGTGTVITIPAINTPPRLLGSLFVNNSNDIILGSNTRIAEDLTIQNGAIILGSNNLSVGGVINGTFSNTSYISQNASGRLFKTYTSLPTSYYIPLGKGTISASTNVISPVDFTSLTASVVPSEGHISITENTTPPFPAHLVDNDYAIKKYWSITAPGLSGVVATFKTTFTGADLSTLGSESNYVTGYNIGPGTIWATGTTSDVVSKVATFNLGNTTALSGNYTVGTKNAFVSVVLYSYQNGSWHDPNTWTEDPSGTLLVNPQVPVNGAEVNILNGRTVTLFQNVTTTGHNIVINNGGTLNLSTFTTSTLTGLSGQGLLRLNSFSFPEIINNGFITSNGGTVEYYNLSGTLPTNITTYNNIWLTKDDNTSGAYIYTLGSNLTTNGDIRIRNLLGLGISCLSIGNNTTARTITGYKNLIIGDAANPKTATLLSVSGFNAQHVINLYGDLLNNGTIDLSNGTQYTASANDQRAALNFLGSTNNQFLCNGPTEVFNVNVNKGTDQTYELHLHATNNTYFRFMIDGVGMQISMGTLRLGNNIVLDRLRNHANYDIGHGPGTTPTVLNSGCQLWIDGAIVKMAAAGTGAANRAIVVYGKFKITNGEITVVGAGLVPRFDGEIEIAGGKVETSKVRPSVVSGVSPKGSFKLSGGEIHINRPTLPDIENYGNHAPFTMPFADQVFQMTGGTMNIYRFGNTSAFNNAFLIINAAPENQVVTGGTINVTIASNNTHVISSRAPIYNLNVYKSTTGTNGILRLQAMSLATEYQTPEFPSLPARPLTILNNLYIDGVNAPALVLGDENLNLRGDFTLSSGAIFNPTGRTTTLYGGNNQNIMLNGSVNGSFGNLTVDKTSTTTGFLLGTIPTLSVTSLNILSGKIHDGGKTILVTGNVVNNATHTGNGTINLVGTTTQSITSNGSGTFSNLRLNNTSGTTGSDAVNLSGNITISNSLHLVSDRVFNIQTSGVRMLEQSVLSAVGSGFGINKMIKTAGNQSDGGLSRFAFNDATVLLFPIGTNGVYAPLTATFSGISTPSNQGFIQVSPTNIELPTLSATGVPNSALQYYWRVRSNSFVSPPQVAYTFNANTASIWPSGTVGSPSNYVSGRIELPNRIPETISVAGDGLVHFPSHTVPNDASYTAAQIGRFNGSVKIFYNLLNGGGSDEIFNNGAFSLLCHTCAGTNDDPGPGDIIRMTTFTNTNQDHWIHISRNLTVGGVIFENRGLGGWRARITINPGYNVNLGNVSGEGEIMQRTNGTPDVMDPIVGDFGDFAAIPQSVFNYQFSAGTGIVQLPSSPTTYPTLRLENGNDPNREFIFPPIPIQINNNLIIGDGAIAYTSTASGAHISITNDLRIGMTGGSRGVLRLNDVGYPKTITVGRDLLLTNSNVGNEITVLNNTLSGLLHRIRVGRNITKQLGTLDLDNGTVAGSNHAEIEFFSTQNGTFLSTGGPTAEFRRFIINKGSDRSSSFTFTSPFNTTNTSNTSTKVVEFQNGILAFSSTGINVNISSGAGNLNIPGTSGLVVANGSTVNMSGTTTGIILDGLLSIQNGGNAIFNDNINNIFIEYSATNNARLEIAGGNLVVGSQIRRNTSATTGTLQYMQTGGNVSILGIGAVVGNAKLELDNSGSGFTMTGGNIIIQRGGGTTYGDLYINPGSSLVTGGNIIFSPLSDIGSQTYRIVSSPFLSSLSIAGVGSSSATGLVMVHPLRINNNLIVGTNGILNLNSFDADIKGNTTISGALIPSTGTISFSGITTQTVRTNTPTTFSNVAVMGGSTVQFTGLNPTVSNLLRIESGATLNDGGLNVLVTNQMIHSGNHTGTGKIVFTGTGVQNVTGNNNGIFQNIDIANSTSVFFNNDFTVNGTINLVAGNLVIGGNKLTLGTSSTILGATSSRFIRMNGVTSDNGIIRNISAAPFDITFPIGVFGKYTPVRYVGSGNSTAGTILVKPVNNAHPLTTDAGNYQLDYYWVVQSTGLNSPTYTHQYTFIPTDINGTASAYKVGRAIYGDWAPYYGGLSSSIAGIDLANNVFTLNGVDFIFGEYTIGEPSEFQQVLTYYSRDATSGGNWDDINAWSTDQTMKHAGPPVYSGLPPYGQPVVIKQGHYINTNGHSRNAYSTSIAGILDVGTTFGHNIGYVKGSGKLVISTNPSLLYVLPAGQYTDFLMSTTGGTLEFSSNADGDLPAIASPHFPHMNNVLLSGTGKKKITSSSPNYTIFGNLSIVGGQLENTANNNIIIKGNWVNNVGIGGFNRGFVSGSYVELSGTNQSVLGSNVFGGLRILGGGNKMFSANNTVNGVLLLSDGQVQMGNNILSIETNDGSVSGGSSSSYVVGYLQKEFNTGSNVTKNFEVGNGGYSPASVSFPSVSSAGRLAVRAFNTSHPNLSSSCLNQTKKVNRYWEVQGGTPSVTPINYTITPTFLNPSDLAGGADPSIFIGGLYNGSVWTLTGIGTRTSTSTQLTGLVSFGGIAIAEPTGIVGVTVLGPAMPVCSASELVFTASGVNGGTSPGYNWMRISSGVTYTGQAFTQVYNGSTLSGGDLVRVVYTSSDVCAQNNPATSSPIAISFGSLGVWTGNENSNWHNPNNWCSMVVPAPATNISINTSPNYPLLSISGHVGNLSIGTSASMSFTGVLLTISGNYTNDGSMVIGNTSSILFKSNSTQAIGGTGVTIFPSLVFEGSGAKTFASMQSLSGGLSVLGTNVTVNANGNLRLLSVGTSTGSTAFIAPIPSGSTITGNVVVERYISPKKTFRFLGSPVKGAMVSQWQNAMHITGPTGCVGCDASLTRVRSVQYYNEPFLGGMNAGFVTITNTGHVLVTGRGYQVFVRGDRNAVGVDDISFNMPIVNAPTVLSLTGPLNIGDVSISITSTTSPFGVTADGWNLVANPYAASIDFDLVYASSTNLTNQMHVWDPNLPGSGGYYSYVGGVASDLRSNGFVIPSGTGFFVKANGNGTITFQESHKTTASPSKVNLRQESISDVFGLVLSNADGTQVDYAAIRFVEGATLFFDNGLDADKITKGNTHIASFDGMFRPLSVQARSPYSEVEQIIPLRTGFDENGDYKIIIRNINSKDKVEQIYLVDTYTQDTILITLEGKDFYDYPFVVNSDPKSRSLIRFALLVKSGGQLLQNATNESQEPNEISLEENININNFHAYSEIIQSNKNSIFNEIKIFPNPCTNGEIYILAPIEGAALISIIKNDGEVIYKNEFIFKNNIAKITELSYLSSGVYYIQVTNTYTQFSSIFKIILE